MLADKKIENQKQCVMHLSANVCFRFYDCRI